LWKKAFDYALDPFLTYFDMLDVKEAFNVDGERKWHACLQSNQLVSILLAQELTTNDVYPIFHTAIPQGRPISSPSAYGLTGRYQEQQEDHLGAGKLGCRTFHGWYQTRPTVSEIRRYPLSSARLLIYHHFSVEI
jgi:hypothetical protein